MPPGRNSPGRLVHSKHSEEDGQHPSHDLTLLPDARLCPACEVDAYCMVGALVDLEVYIASLNGQGLFAPLATHKGVAIAVVAGYDSAVFLDGVAEDSAFQSRGLRRETRVVLSLLFIRPVRKGQGSLHEHVNNWSFDLNVVFTHFVMIEVLVEFLRNAEPCRQHRVVRLFG